MRRFKSTFNSLTGEHSVRLAGEHFMTMAQREPAHQLARILNDLDDLVQEMNEPVGPFENRSEVNRFKAAYAVCKALGLGERFDVVADGRERLWPETLDAIGALTDSARRDRDDLYDSCIHRGTFDTPCSRRLWLEAAALVRRGERILARHGRRRLNEARAETEGGRDAVR